MIRKHLDAYLVERAGLMARESPHFRLRFVLAGGSLLTCAVRAGMACTVFGVGGDPTANRSR
jgi:hypothetical protein